MISVRLLDDSGIHLRPGRLSGYDRLAYVHQDCYVVAVDLRRRGLISARRRGLKDKGIFEFFPQFPPDVGGHPLALHEIRKATTAHAHPQRLPHAALANVCQFHHARVVGS